MTGKQARRLPLEPLVERMQARYRNPSRWTDNSTDGQLSIVQMTELLGVDRQAWHRWQRKGGLTVRHADRAAIALGLHPVDIWPEFYDDIEATA